MPFQKGHEKIPGSGRRAGIPPRQLGVEAFTRSIVEDAEYKAMLVVRAKKGELSPGVETMLWHYAYGKPVEPNRDDEQFLVQLVTVMDKYASSPEAQQEIRAVVAAYTTGGSALRAVA